MAQNVARELKVTLSGKETERIQSVRPTSNQLAYDFYLRGNEYFSRNEFSPALEMYSKAIKEDSLFGAAFAKRAGVNVFLYWIRAQGWEGNKKNAAEDVNSGMRLNPELPELKLARAMACYYLNRDYEKALKILKELKSEAPGMSEPYTYSAFILRRQGKSEESIVDFQTAIKLDPFSASFIAELAWTYEWLHQYDKEIECTRNGLSLIPDYKTFNRIIFQACLNKNGDFKSAIKESGLKEEEVQREVYYYNRQWGPLTEFLKKDTSTVTNQYAFESKHFRIAQACYFSGNKSLCKIYADSAISLLREKIKASPDDDRFYANLGKCYALIGIDEEAVKCGKKAINLKPVTLDAVQGTIKEQDLMEIYTYAGKYDLAMDKIEDLLAAPSLLAIGQLMIDPLFDNLRSLPRFQEIVHSAQIIYLHALRK